MWAVPLLSIKIRTKNGPEVKARWYRITSMKNAHSLSGTLPLEKSLAIFGSTVSIIYIYMCACSFMHSYVWRLHITFGCHSSGCHVHCVSRQSLMELISSTIPAEEEAPEMLFFLSLSPELGWQACATTLCLSSEEGTHVLMLVRDKHSMNELPLCPLFLTNAYI